jgi:hypothetical protein
MIYNFTVASVFGPFDADSDFTTDPLNTKDDQGICHSKGWSFEMDQIGLTDESGTWTLEVTDNLALGNWKSYKSNSIDKPVVDGYDDDHFTWSFLRVVYKSNTETTGTVNPSIFLKK